MISSGAGGRGADQGPAARQLLRIRVALTAFFAVDGFVFAGWVVRIPDVKERTGASPSALGLALLGVSVGAVVTMTLTGRLCQRYGNHRVTVWAGALLVASVALPAHAGSAVALGAVLLLFGAGFGAVNVAANSAAVDLVAALRRPVMPSFHAAFSLGGMLGAGLGGLLADRLGVARHLALLAALGLVVVVWAGRTLWRESAGGGQGAGSGAGSAVEERGSGAAGGGVRRGSVGWLVGVLGLIALCTTYGEGAMADWSALHLKETLGASAGVAAAGYSVFAMAMTVGRLTGSAVLARLGATRALVAGGALGAAGMLLGALAPTLWLALVGFALTGLGLANVFPITIGTAGQLAGPRGVAMASTIGYGGMLAGPVAIGFLADWFSLAAALVTVAVLSGVAAVTSWATREALRRGTA
ncbi:MFS transporter [Streptomyces triticirhizae]|uniref:MFS transporter n=2 Tax=Streptomyces triticirhizae TaxID=2483353 RepID=A0A3M2LJS1_9ACTN|nr:MFS transporter [Streptomyces triticirhizae]RMI36265.1 MFS transporter [Streptomyces triticirhizae]